MVLLEAMSYGIPCIAYETASGVTDIIANDVNGYVISHRNEKQYIDKLNNLINDEKLRKKMGKECLQTINKFKKEEITKKWIYVLKESVMKKNEKD